MIHVDGGTSMPVAGAGGDGRTRWVVLAVATGLSALWIVPGADASDRGYFDWGVAAAVFLVPFTAIVTTVLLGLAALAGRSPRSIWKLLFGGLAGGAAAVIVFTVLFGVGWTVIRALPGDLDGLAGVLAGLLVLPVPVAVAGALTLLAVGPPETASVRPGLA